MPADDLDAALRAALPAPVAADHEAVAALVDLHHRAAAGWPELTVAPARLATEVVRRLGPELTAATVRALHHDLVLAIAAADGDPTAAAACDRIASREVDFAAGRLRATQTQADDLRSDLRRLLFVADDDRAAALTAFTGRGDLRGYLRVIVARALTRRIQKDRREQSLEDDLVDAVAPQIDPEVAMLRDHYRAEVDAAFRRALAALSDRARAVLRYHLLDGWTIDEIGERYGVHRATAARWITAAHAELGAGIRSDLAARLSISDSQVDSIVALVTSRIEVSLGPLLGGRPA